MTISKAYIFQSVNSFDMFPEHTSIDAEIRLVAGPRTILY